MIKINHLGSELLASVFCKSGFRHPKRGCGLRALEGIQGAFGKHNRGPGNHARGPGRFLKLETNFCVTQRNLLPIMQ